MAQEVNGIFGCLRSIDDKHSLMECKGAKLWKEERFDKEYALLNWKADVVCLEETKLEGDISNIVKDIWGNRWADYVHLEASGTEVGVGGSSDHIRRDSRKGS